MAYRIVKVNSRCKLETSLNYLVYRAEKETRILLDEIAVLIIENQQACLTSALISECMNHGIRIIFCDGKHSPQGELEPYNGCYDGLSKYRLQSAWKEEVKNLLWQKIVKQKINNQRTLLERKGDADRVAMLTKFIDETLPGDPGNREGLAAKVYFQGLFGNKFDRRDETNQTNAFLNYGYSLLLSLVNREIASFGYMNHVGIHHIGETNPFNLGCDFMEPFRPFIDEAVVNETIDMDNYKKVMMDAMGKEVGYLGKKMLLQNAVRPYVMSALSFLNEKGKEMPPLGFSDGNL